MNTVRAGALVGTVLIVGAASLSIDAHKPITSPYTFTEDVLPILRDRCGACHVAGGPAPMPLTTVEETVPWGESIRLELIAGHMPPWSAMSGGRRLRHAEGLTARELNVLLTWVTGGAPPGDTAPPAIPAARAEWPLGTPDVTLPLPEVTLGADQGELTREFVLPLDAGRRRPLRAVDLQPGTRSLVRSARVAVRTSAPGSGNTERVVALWVPGDQPVALPADAAFAVPADAELVVTVRFKKTWEHEREAMADRSAVGLYFAAEGAGPVTALPLLMPDSVPPPSPASGVSGLAFGRRFDAGATLLAFYPTEAAAGATITVDAIRPGGPERLLEFTPRRGWERRYWFETPTDWPAGTQLQVGVTLAGEDAARPAPATPLLVLDAVLRR